MFYILHLYDHTIKPILMYGSEITGMFKTSSAACRKENEYLLQQTCINEFIDKSHFKYLKYILGVNKKSTKLAVLSELGRYPLYFSVVLSMLKYWFRIDKMESGLLSDAYIANQSMVSDNTECWLSSIKFILQKLNIQHTGIKLIELARSVRKRTRGKT